jgi:CHAT domain-containing protein/tetratricopeptide (TPR) repeat protein
VAAGLLGNLGGAQFSLHQFRASLGSYQEAEALAQHHGLNALAAALTANIASLYSQLGESDAASDWLERSLSRLTGADGEAYRPKVQAQLATVRMRQGRVDDARGLFLTAIGSAESRGDLALATQLWNRMGEEFLYRGDLAAAETSLLEAWRLRTLHHLPSDAPYFNLGKLRLAQGNLEEAEPILNRVVARAGEPNGILPTWDIYLQRGRLRLAQGKLSEALTDLRISRRLARAWRWAAPANDAARVGTEGTLQQVHDALVEAAGRLYLQTRAPALLDEGFSAADENRAASLRSLLADPQRQDLQLPASFWRAASRLQAAEVEALRDPGAARDASVRQARAELVSIEAGSGIAAPPAPEHLLTATRAALDADSAVLALHLGAAMSWLWAVDGDGAALYRLPPAGDVSAVLDRWSRAVRDDSSSAPRAGAEVFHLLFGPLDPHFRRRSRWLLALDGDLLQAPLAALVDTAAGSQPYLIQTHSLELVPAVSMLFTAGRERPGDGFLGVGDAIYNTSDPRRPRTAGFAWRWPAFGSAPAASALQLPRLVSSAAEIEACARAWHGPQTLLEGSAATRTRLQDALAGKPAIVHVAAHFLQSGQRSGYGLLALSLDRTGRTEVVAPHEIAHWRTAADLVVLSGCTSAAGAPLPGTGVFGLTRAWLAAGAHHVVATRWVTPDDTGTLFRALYQHWREHPGLGPAGALRQAQQDMIAAGGWRSRPAYWAAYFSVGTAQLAPVSHL